MATSFSYDTILDPKNKWQEYFDVWFLALYINISLGCCISCQQIVSAYAVSHLVGSHHEKASNDKGIMGKSKYEVFMKGRPRRLVTKFTSEVF